MRARLRSDFVLKGGETMLPISRRTFHHLLLMSAGCELGLWDHPALLRAERPTVALQPLAAQIKRLLNALQSLGEPLSQNEVVALNAAFANPSEGAGIEQVQGILDQHVLLNVEINPESRISVSRGLAKAQLVEQGWRTFLIKVRNQAGDTSPFNIYCPQARPMGRMSALAITGVHDFTNGAVDIVEARDRWAAANNWDKPPLQPTLSGLEIEYRVLQIYSRDRGQREASLEARAGAGEQDLGYRSTLSILFDCRPTNDFKLQIPDVDGRPTTASLLITDSLNRVYPEQGKRSLPDLWFERQIYRRDGETIRLPAGTFSIEYGRGPEYLRKRISLSVLPGTPAPVALSLERWVKPDQHGYYSGDTHIHAAGCAHYESPYEGVTPEVMFRQVQGEALDIGDVLTWAPGYYYQKRFFSGHVHQFEQSTGSSPKGSGSVSVNSAMLRYDIEVSGFPSSHCGHLVLLRLAEQNYPGTTTLDEWPSWNVPILKWAKAQGAVTGYAHSAGGLTVDSTELPNYLMPRFDSSGANEYIVDVTHGDLIDFISGCDLWPFAELNIWYHVLNCGFRTSFAGETDFPCITDQHVGGGRSYVRLDVPPSGDEGYSNWVSGIKEGRSYVGDGRSHIFAFSIAHEGRAAQNNQVILKKATDVHVTAKVCARLEPEIDDGTEKIHKASPYDRPYWHLERARIGTSRTVPVELIVNGIPVQRREIEADGTLHAVEFDVPIGQSSWLALRILPSSHANPIEVLVDGTPVRACRKSAEWCRKAVDICWQQKALRIRTSEVEEAKAAFDHARSTYDRIISECHI
jgi:hypothetical protein